MEDMIVISILVGIALLLAGRRLFWLFVGAAGFLYGLGVTPRLYPDQPEFVVMLLAIAAGVIGAVLAIFLQKIAIGLAGALFGGYLLAGLSQNFGGEIGGSELLLFIIGGIAGAVLVIILFDWALIVLSSLAGAALIVHPLAVSHLTEMTIFAAAAVVGILVQTGSFLRGRSAARVAPS
jgi:hypothetical protein